MIDFDNMEVGATERLPHPTEWSGENRNEYLRAQDCTQRTGALFSVDTLRNTGGQITGYTITRTQ